MTPLPPFASLRLDEIAAALGAQVESADGRQPFGPPSTDSRAIRVGEWFVALRGEKFDGHQFCAAAVERGAAGLVVDRAYSVPAALAGVARLRVADTLAAWGDLAAMRRAQWGGTVLALSGSAGKTTTRRLLATALARRLKTLEPIRNFNNLIGLPHTLLRLEADHAVAVLELGMNIPGELARLTRVARPSAVAITQIGMAHVGMFDSLDALVAAELEVFDECAAGTPYVANAGCPRTMAHVARYAPAHPIVYFCGEAGPLPGATPAVRIENVRPIEGGRPVGYRFDLALPGGRLGDLELRLFGRHHLENVAAAAALLHAGGFDPAWVADALDGFRTEAHRGEVIDAEGMTLVLDCYNASPPAMTSALRSLADFPCPNGTIKRRVLVLGDMLELGEHAETAHDAQLEAIRALRPAALFGLGPQTTRLAARLAGEGLAARGFGDRDALAAALRDFARPGDMIFFKGSHGFRLEKVAATLAPAGAIATE